MRQRIEQAIERVIEQARKELITTKLNDAINNLEQEWLADRAAREILMIRGNCG